MNRVIVTGGAGFIGSCIVRTLNDEGITDIIIVDNVASTEKWKNLRNKQYTEYVNKSLFLEKLANEEFGCIDAIIHMGACSSTTELSFDYLWNNNVEYTQELWKYCTKHQIPFIYASSAATYGDGSQGFSDLKDINGLLPLNGYGYSKQFFDQWAEKQEEKPVQHVGLKFFNVYGPNEYCKGNMASMVYHGYNQLNETGCVRLFKSYHMDYADGEQLRDFVYVKDICKVIMFFLKHPDISGLYNVGTGKAQSFRELIEAIFHALSKPVSINYIDMPEQLKRTYQYYTQADLRKLRDIGYDEEFFDVETGVSDYVNNYLAKQYEVY